MLNTKKLLLRHRRAPGDITVFSALIRDIKRTYPELELYVQSSFWELWENNPYLVGRYPLSQRKVGVRGVKTINCTYGKGLQEQNRETIHFLAYFHRDFERQTGLKVPLTEPIPDLHLSETERTQSLLPSLPRYWVMVAGGKNDMPAKVWHAHRFEQVARRMVDAGIPVVQGGGALSSHWAPQIPGVVNMVGRTSTRQFMQLVQHAEGVICGITWPMHLAAALNKPCVVLGGGREAWYWEAYVRENVGLGGPEVANQLKMPHRYLHTIGLLSCCQYHGCWRAKVERPPQASHKVWCEMPTGARIEDGARPGALRVPKCLDMISVDHVLEAVMSYYVDGSLPPIGPSPQPITAEELAQAAHGAVRRSSFTPAKTQPTMTNELPKIIPTLVQPAGVMEQSPLVLSGPAESAVDELPLIVSQTAPTTTQKPAPLPEVDSLQDDNWLAEARRLAARAMMAAQADVQVLAAANAVPTVPDGRPAAAPQTIVANPLRVPTQDGMPRGPSPLHRIINDPAIGGKFTICVLMYGPEKYHRMQARVLDEIRQTVPADCRELRVGANALNQQSLRMLRQLEQAGEIRKVYEFSQNRYKYPVMREIFHDVLDPIDTRWTIWFDDDMFCGHQPHWATDLAQRMIRYDEKVHCFGDIRYFKINSAVQRQWYETRPWHHGKPWRDAQGRPSPNHSTVRFVTGGMWAIRTDAIRVADIPDRELANNLGDVTIGEQLYQNGFVLGEFNQGMKLITTNKENRRGVQTSHPGSGIVTVEREFDHLRQGIAEPPRR